MVAQVYSGFLTGDPDAVRSWTQSLARTGLQALEPTAADRGNANAGEYSLFSNDSAGYYGRVDDEPVIAALLGAPYDLGSDQTPALDLADIAARVVRRGAAELGNIGGPFSVAVLLPQRREALLAIDRFAVGNLYYIVNNGIAFANRTSLLTNHPACANNFSMQAIYDYLYFHCLPSPDAGYTAIQRLQAGHYLHWRDGAAAIEAYWRPRYTEDKSTSETSFSAELDELFRNAISRRIDDRATGCFLSGGLDSSTVTGIGAQCNAGKVTAFSIGFDSPDYDEMEFARAAATHFDVPLVPYYVTPNDVAEALPAIVDAFDGPFGNASAVPAYYCAKLAADAGMPVILAGDGGDELFGGNTRYAKQLLFEKYSTVPRWIRGSIIEPGVKIVPGPVKRKLTRYIEQARIPLPDRLMTYNLLEMVGAETFLTPEFLASVDIGGPLRSLRNMYEMDGEVSPLNRMLHLDLLITLADSDLPKVSRMCELAGIPVAYPMLDEAVFDLAARLPTSLKVRPRELRYFFKKTFADLLPESTLTKSKHGFGLPFGVWLETDPGLHELVAANLTVLEDAGILLPGFRDRFLSAEFREHAGYYGTLLWVLTCLGLWLQRQRPSLT